MTLKGCPVQSSFDGKLAGIFRGVSPESLSLFGALKIEKRMRMAVKGNA